MGQWGNGARQATKCVTCGCVRLCRGGMGGMVVCLSDVDDECQWKQVKLVEQVIPTVTEMLDFARKKHHDRNVNRPIRALK
jgi:hypothetical protein